MKKKMENDMETYCLNSLQGGDRGLCNTGLRVEGLNSCKGGYTGDCMGGYIQGSPPNIIPRESP